jgi:hypothetical protein
MKVASAVAFAALSLALASALEPPLTAQETLLSEQITGNFACKVDAVDVNLDLAGAEEKTTITTDDLKTALARTATLEWAHVNQFFFSSTDGRDDEKSLFTGGGDMGEFIQALVAYTKVTSATLTQADVTNLFARYLKLMSKEKFFYETDEKAYYKLAIYTGCPNLKIAEVGERAKKKALTDAFMSTDAFEFIGDPYLKWMLLSADELDFPKEYISYGIIAFHEALWANDAMSAKLCYREVKGNANPKAIIHVKTPGYCVDQGLAPLISAQMCTGQVFIDHPDAVKLYRRELVQLIAKAGDTPQDILSNFNTIVAEFQDKFYDQFSGVPRFTVTFTHTTLSAE